MRRALRASTRGYGSCAGRGSRPLGREEQRSRRDSPPVGTSVRISPSGRVLAAITTSALDVRYQGSGATLAYFGQLAQETGGTFRAELQHMAADGDNRVVGIQRSTADRGGKHLDVANCIVFELKDGKVTDGREHFEDLYAWDEFWS
ncbi:MAG: nuclear transport factor 2 family protein [Actinobacteria bacterium]|nr:MAG: nuclear transport factor 2 family protein [Actinomycetota bacterium]